METDNDKWITIKSKKTHPSSQFSGKREGTSTRYEPSRERPSTRYEPSIQGSGKVFSSSNPPQQKPLFKSNDKWGNGGNGRPNGRRGGTRGPEIVKEFFSEEEKVKFLKLQQEIPHLCMPHFIRDYVAFPKLKLDNWTPKMLSDEWIQLQRDGWKYFKVIRSEENNEDYFNVFNEEIDLVMSLDNKWDDAVAFKKVGY